MLEYVVVHELAHLKHRSHGEAFWAFLASILPDYQRAKAWLERHQASLDSGFLDAPARHAAPALGLSTAAVNSIIPDEIVAATQPRTLR